SVSIASKMESTSESMKIHISQPTKDLLPSSYHVTARDKIYVKEKGFIKTYWLQTRNFPLQNNNLRPHLGEFGSILESESPARPFITDKTEFSYTPVMYYDMALGSVNSPANLIRDCPANWSSHSPADFFGSEINYSVVPTYNNSETSKHASEKEDITPLKDKLLLTATSKYINSLSNESRTASLINPGSIKTKLAKASKTSTRTINNDETSLQLNKLKRSNQNRKYSSNNSLNQCCSRFNLSQRNTFQANACSIT
ncbi:Adenylate and Guanylate cyclase, partial [Oryctes borbonicus]